MKSLQHSIDLLQFLFSIMFILIMTIACLWIVKPFMLGFAWASIVVIATWPLMIYFQNILWNKRALAIVIMTILLLLLFIIPIFLLVNSLIDNKTTLTIWINKGHIALPKLLWIKDIPIIGKKIYSSYHDLVDGGSTGIIRQLQPYIGRTTSFFVAQVGHLGKFVMHITLMLLFSVMLYWRGESIGYRIRHLAYRVGGNRGDTVVFLAGQTIRSVALGVVITALLQGVFGGIGLAVLGIPCATLLTICMILTCLIQLGPLFVLVPVVIWLYSSGNTVWGTIMLVWSCIVVILDNILRPILIRMSADLPMFLILSGIIGGLIAFGTIGLFIGPVVLAVSYRLISIWTNEVPAPDKDIEKVIEAMDSIKS